MSGGGRGEFRAVSVSEYVKNVEITAPGSPRPEASCGEHPRRSAPARVWGPSRRAGGTGRRSAGHGPGAVVERHVTVRGGRSGRPSLTRLRPASWMLAAGTRLTPLGDQARPRASHVLAAAGGDGRQSCGADRGARCVLGTRARRSAPRPGAHERRTDGPHASTRRPRRPRPSTC
ncbi:hypothetical protein HBB16_10785 [Pseudonocardia sp. MCCB 268]|nr:hypothetical protein [Pseudonocardia cytotoxica]